jgi:hypothetical protein
VRSAAKTVRRELGRALGAILDPVSAVFDLFGALGEFLPAALQRRLGHDGTSLS